VSILRAVGEAEACIFCGARFFDGEGRHRPGCEGADDLVPNDGTAEDNETTK
jgi:hypothetical protein